MRLRCPIKPATQNYSFRRTNRSRFTASLRSNPGVVCRTEVVSINVPTARLDAIVHQDVAFVKIDVEGHELNVLNGAVELLEHSQPVFLVEAEDRHRVQATRSIFEFFESRSYRGFFLKQGNAVPIDQFRPADLQDASVLLPDGGRKSGQSYVNNFFFFPQHLDGDSILNS